MAHHENDLTVSHPRVQHNSTPSPADLVADVTWRQDVTQRPGTASNSGWVDGEGEKVIIRIKSTLIIRQMWPGARHSSRNCIPTRQVWIIAAAIRLFQSSHPGLLYLIPATSHPTSGCQIRKMSRQPLLLQILPCHPRRLCLIPATLGPARCYQMWIIMSTVSQCFPSRLRCLCVIALNSTMEAMTINVARLFRCPRTPVGNSTQNQRAMSNRDKTFF